MPEITPEQKQQNYSILQSLLINSYKRGCSTFKCKALASRCNLSASAIGRFYINKFVRDGMIEVLARPKRGITYKFRPEYFKGEVN